MKRILDLSEVPTPQLREIKRILSAGISAVAETESAFAAEKSYLCHKSPPKGYPEEKSEYGDPACYRYPLNTKARCLAAWRYVHHSDNKAILGGKFKSVESKIKSYAKKHYNLDLQVGESDEFDWEQAFMEYYDAETMGERCELIDLEPDDSEASNVEGEKEMEDKERIEALDTENKSLKDANETLTTEKAGLEEKASQVDTLTQELSDQKEELETLRQYKQDREEADQKAERIKSIKEKLEAAELEADVDADAEYWLGMSDDTLEKTITMMSNLKKQGAEASADKHMKVPPVSGDDETDAKTIVSESLKERKQAKDN